ncbi:hypothetical protein F4804DRAFT_319297 [Jackrogersella minutella]|nr:hypothetical protein F4804DRAFT_319297 [Jackrogersella minutella]
MDRQNSSGAPSLVQETPPPPYSQYLDNEEEENEDISSARSDKVQDLSEPPSPHIVPTTSAFPTTWVLYHTLSMSQILMIGSREHGPLFAVTKHSGWWTGQPDLVLHRGPHASLPALAAGMGGAGIGRHSIIVLPPPPGFGQESSQELLLRVEDKDNTEWKSHVSFRFTIEVGTDPSRYRRETFEWQHTHGELISVFLDRAKDGWKLVRLDGDEDGDSDGPEPHERQEIVAVWAYARMSMTKVLKFRYLGNGATGAFGGRWAIMAAMTAMRMYQRQQNNRNKDW